MQPAATQTGKQTVVEVLIIGAGFGGICTAIRLQQQGISDFVLLEKATEVGGTWEANTYPGCACDVQSHLYSYSFEANPDWSHVFAPQPEIWRYIRHCADKYELGARMRLGTGVRRARYDEAGHRWHVETDGGDVYLARFVVAATGGLSVPALPNVDGLEKFEGDCFHSARWNHEVDLRGKRVAVVGTGASAIQIVPSIAPEVGRLALFQRTPPWILPRLDRRFTRVERWLCRRVPWLRRFYRALLYFRLESRALVFTVAPVLAKLIRFGARWNIRRGVADPALREALTPDYDPGCKRVLLSDDYYPSLVRDNVDVVCSGVREITASQVVAEDGTRFDADVIVFATGFRATAPIPPGLFEGRDGLDLVERWEGGAEAFKGMAVSGFPNLFLLMGPNTGLGHNSVVFMIEAQVHYLLEALAALRNAGSTALEVRRAVEADYNRKVQRRLERTIWNSGCKSWYLDENGRNVTLWPGFTLEYWFRTRRFRPSDYEFAPPPGGP